ncbi:MAG TPA: PGPGW domain-containing protein [Actinomycetota bacterium]|nr:PGPGW domain-containing protein [Actinomycetota bacterium]
MSVAMGSVARWVWFPFDVTIRFMLRNGKRIGVTIVGVLLVLGGLVLMVLPGPGVLLLIAGLAVLATEYVWAQRMLNYTKRKATQAKDTVLGRNKAAPPAEPPKLGPQG